MKLRAIHAPGRLLRKLRAADSALRDAAVEAAAEALRGELQRESENLILVVPQGSRRAVGSANGEDAAREFGTLERTAAPWLAPVLPLALEPMRAAATARVRDLFAARAGAENAAARTLSQLGRKK